MTLSILIPSYNWDCSQLVQDLLEQIPEDAEIIVGNDKSTLPNVISAFQYISTLKQCKIYEPAKNLGRARILNRLFELSSGKWILIMDCDTKIDNPNYIKDYLTATENHNADAFCGGMKNTETCPPGCELRWNYETRVAKKLTVSYRQEHPYESLTTQNFLISREAFIQTGFLEEITQYGYEDIILIQQLQRQNKKIHHLENRLIHLDIDTNKGFLAKSRQALRTLHSLPQEAWPDTRLTRLYHKLRSHHLHRALALAHLILLPITKRLLHSRFAPISLFQFYKLGYFCGL